jgi:hypothetical protein
MAGRLIMTVHNPGKTLEGCEVLVEKVSIQAMAFVRSS